MSRLLVCHRCFFLSLSPHHVSWSVAPAACLPICTRHSCRSATSTLPLLPAPPALHLLISRTSSLFANLHQYLSSGLWLTQCQIIFRVMWDLPVFVYYFTARNQPILSLTCFCSLFSQIPCLPSVPDHQPLGFFLPVNSCAGFFILQKTLSSFGIIMLGHCENNRSLSAESGVTADFCSCDAAG